MFRDSCNIYKGILLGPDDFLENCFIIEMTISPSPLSLCRVKILFSSFSYYLTIKLSAINVNNVFIFILATLDYGFNPKLFFYHILVTKAKPFQVRIYKVQKSEKEVFKKKHCWQLNDLKTVDGINEKQVIIINS